MSEADFYRDLGMLLRWHRKRLKMSQGSIAVLLGLSRVSICNIERGIQKAPAYTYVRYGGIVGLKLRWSSLMEGGSDG